MLFRSRLDRQHCGVPGSRVCDSTDIPATGAGVRRLDRREHLSAGRRSPVHVVGAFHLRPVSVLLLARASHSSRSGDPRRGHLRRMSTRVRHLVLSLASCCLTRIARSRKNRRDRGDRRVVFLLGIERRDSRRSLRSPRFLLFVPEIRALCDLCGFFRVKEMLSAISAVSAVSSDRVRPRSVVMPGVVPRTRPARSAPGSARRR